MKARIIRNIRDNILIRNDNGIEKAELKGIFRLNNIKPIVGDYINYETLENKNIVDTIYDRKNFLERPNAVNVDLVIIIQSVIEPNINSLFLDKMINFYETKGPEIKVAITKMDIHESDDIQKLINQYKEIGYDFINTNNKVEFDDLLKSFENKTICLVGNSGVGKSTFINKIDPKFNIKTQEISKALNRGKHTTTTVNIIKHKNYELIDTPGFATVKLEISKFALSKNYFNHELGDKECKFRDCLHLTEDKCAVKTLLENNKIFKWRYKNYLSLIEDLDNIYDKK